MDSSWHAVDKPSRQKVMAYSVTSAWHMQRFGNIRAGNARARNSQSACHRVWRGSESGHLSQETSTVDLLCHASR